MTIFKYAMLRNLRSPASYFLGLLMPVTYIIFMTSIWRETPAAGLNLLVFFMFMSASLLAGLILEDRIDGSIMKILIAPVTMVRYIFQNLLASLIPLLIQIVFLGIMGLFRYNWTWEFTAGALIILFVCALTTAAFAFCWNSFFKSKNGSRYSFMFFMAVVMLLSGILIPMEALPGVLQHVGAVFYPYWFIRASAVLDGYGMTFPFWQYNGIILLFGVGFLLLGGKRRKI